MLLSFKTLLQETQKITRYSCDREYRVKTKLSKNIRNRLSETTMLFSLNPPFAVETHDTVGNTVQRCQ